MTLVPLFDLTQQFNNKNGAVLVGGKLYVYYVGRTDLATTWADEDASATNTNPVLLDNNGRAPVFVDDSYAYTLVVCDRNGAELFSQDITPGGAGSVGGRIVYHDETLTGNGTVASLLGANTFPLGVDETMTAYTGVAEGKDALILGVNGDWFSANFLSGLNNKVDWSAFNSAYYGLKGSISSKADWSALNNYFTKNETTYMLSDYIKTSAMNNILQNYYTIPQTDALLDQKQDNLTFEYNDSSAISSINGSALAGDGDNCPWISGSKVIAPTQTLTSNMIIQILSSFDLSGYKNHNIGLKGGTYRFPNEYEIGSALLHTNYFMHLSGMSAYIPLSAFSSYTASIANNLENNWNYTNSAYSLSINNFYNKLDASAFSAWSAVQDPVLIGDSNITATSSRVDNHTQWNLAVNGTPVVTDTTLIGDNCVTAHTTQTSGEWIVGLVQSAYEAIDSIDGISNDVDTLKNASGNYYPLTGNPSGFINDLSDYFKKTETSSKEQISAAIASIPQGDPDVNSFVQTNSSTIVSVDNVVTANSGLWLTAHQTIPSAKWENASDVVRANSAQWAENTGDTEVNNYVYNNSGINNEVNNVVTANSGVWNNVTNKLDTTAFTAWSSTIFDEDYELSAGEGISITDDAQNRKTIISNNISAGSNISLVYDVETNKIRIDGEGGGKTYSGVAPILVDNVNDSISISGESLSAGPGIDLFESGGYVVISAYGAAGSTFPITGSNGTTAYTANMDCSSVLLTTASSPAGGYVKQTVRGVQYEAYPATDVSASWYNIINGANNRSNCYCIRFTNDMTAAYLEDYSAYDKVTVVHSNQYTPDCMLYWDGNTKVFPSGLYCELVKGTNDQNQTDWFFTTSGWINNLEWDWD